MPNAKRRQVIALKKRGGKNDRIALRLPDGERDRYEAFAARRRWKISEWVRYACEQQAEREATS